MEPLLPDPRPSRRSMPWHALLFIATFATAVLAGGLAYATALLAILGAHEMGHYLACRRYGVRATLPFFLPGFPPLGTFGAVIRIRGAIPHRRALFDIAAAGPIAGFVVALPALVIGLVLAEPTPLPFEAPGGLHLGPPLLDTLLSRWLHSGTDLRVGALYAAGWAGMLVTSMNLFPVGQLDGGHAAYALSRRLHRGLSWATLAGLGAFVLWTGVHDRELSPYTVWLLVLAFLRDRHPPLLHESGPLGAKRRLVACLLALLFALSFIPVPFRWTGS